MFSLDLSKVRSVLCLGAHADDIEIGCGGTLLSLMQSIPGLRMDWVVMSGDTTRASEARASFQAWGGVDNTGELYTYDFPDTLFPWHGVEIKKAIHDVSRRVQPDLVFTHYRSDMHQDHVAINQITWNAFRNHLILEYEIPKYEGDLGQPNVFLPLDEVVAGRKVQLLMEHFASQRSKPWYSATTFNSLMHLRGIECNSSTGYAEAFHARKVCLATG